MKMSDAENQLMENQGQLDMDGIMVAVSRQALEEVLAQMASMRDMLSRADEIITDAPFALGEDDAVAGSWMRDSDEWLSYLRRGITNDGT